MKDEREKRDRMREGGQGDREAEEREVKASRTSRCEMLVRMQEKFRIVLVKITFEMAKSLDKWKNRQKNKRDRIAPYK